MADLFSTASNILQKSPVAQATKQVLGGLSQMYKAIPPKVIENMKKLAPIPAPIRFPDVPAIHNTSDAVIKAPTLDFSKASIDVPTDEQRLGIGQFTPISERGPSPEAQQMVGLKALDVLSKPAQVIGKNILETGAKGLQALYQSPAAVVKALDTLDLREGFKKLIPAGMEADIPFVGKVQSTFGTESGDEKWAQGAWFAVADLNAAGITPVKDIRYAKDAFVGQIKSGQYALQRAGIAPMEIDATGGNIFKAVNNKLKTIHPDITGTIPTPEVKAQIEALSDLKDYVRTNPITSRIAAIANQHSINPEQIYQGMTQNLERLALTAPKETVYRQTIDDLNSLVQNPKQFLSEHGGLSIQDVTQKGKMTMLKPKEGGLSTMPSVTDLGVSIPAAIKSSPLLAEAKKYGTEYDFITNTIRAKKSDTYPSLKELVRSEPIESFGNIGDKVSKIQVKQITGDKSVSEWTNRIQNGERPPVVIGKYKGGDIEVIDGNHRLQAYKNLNIKDVPVIDQSDLTSIWNQAHSTGTESSLLAEAKKYSTPEEFVKAPLTQKKLDILRSPEAEKYEYHLSVEPNLKEGKSFAEQTRTISEAGERGYSAGEGIYSTKQPQYWESQLAYEGAGKTPTELYLVKVKEPAPSLGTTGQQTVSNPKDVVVVKKILSNTSDELLDIGKAEAVRNKEILTSIWKQAHGKGSAEIALEVKKPVRFEIGKKLTEPEKQEVLKSLSDSYKTKRRPYTVEDNEGIEKRVYTEDAGEYMVTSDITGKKLRHYVTLPDGKIAHPTEVYGNITKREIDSMANELDIKDAEYNSLVNYLDSVGEKQKAISAVRKAIDNGAQITDTGIRFPGKTFSITIPEYIRNTTGSFAGLQNLEELGNKEHNILSQADWKRLLEEQANGTANVPTSLPTATGGRPITPGDISKAAEEKVMIKPEQPTDLSYLTTKKDFNGHLKTFISRLVDSEAIKKIGKSGERIFNKIKLAEHTAIKEGSDAMFKLKSKLETLSNDDTTNFFDYVEGKKPTPMSAQAAVDEWKNIAKDIANKSQEYGIMIKTPGGKVPFKPKADYVPYYVDENKLDLALKSAVKKNDLLQEMASKGKITVAKASEILDDMVNGKESMFGHLEKARMANLPDSFYKREPVYLFDYIKNSYDRLSMAKEFGGDDAGLQALIEEARKSGADYQELQALTERALGRETFDKTITNISRGARAYNNITKLSLAALTNIGDIVKPFVRTNFLSAIKGIRQSFTKPGVELAEKSGVTGKYIKDVLDVVGDTTIDSKMFKITGFNFTENKLRQIAVNAAKNYVDLLVKKLKANPNNVFALRRLEQFGLDGKELLKNGVKESDYIDAGIQAVADAQPTSKLDIPYYWQSPVGKMATQYKTFSYKQARFFGKFIKDELKQGNPKPLIMFLLAGAAVGEGVADLKAAARGRTRIGWDDPVRRIIDNLMTVGGIGLATDFLANMQYGTLGGGFLKFVVGPTLSDVDDTISRTVSDIQNIRGGKDIVFGRPPDTGETQIKMLKKAIYSVPVLGPIVSNLLFPTRGNYQSKTIPIAEDILQLMNETDKTTKADEIRKRLKQVTKKNVADEIRKKLKQ